MIATMSLQDIFVKLLSSDPAVLFGDDPHKAIREYRARLHPDRFIGQPEEAEKADGLRKSIEMAYEHQHNPVILKSPKRTYSLIGQIATGDVADMWLANTDESDAKYVVKCSRVPEGARMLATEAEHLKKSLSAAGTTAYADLLPRFCESFPVRDSMAKTVNVFLFEPNLFTLEAVHIRHPELDPRHVAWIFKRLLAVLGIVHRAGVIHSAVSPEHVLVEPVSHKIVLVGWGQSVKDGAIVKYGSAKYDGSWLPREIIARQPAGPGTDIFMAAVCMNQLFGASAPPRKMGTFFRSCIMGGLKMRPDDAWNLLDEFDVMLREIFGKPRYINLEM